MADYFTHFSCLLDVGSTANAAQAEAIRRAQADALDEAEGANLGFDMEVDAASGPGALWISSDGYGEPEHVIAFVLACAEAFDLKGLWGFRWALTCSRPRLDGYGGGAQLLDLGRRCSLCWTDAEHWLQEEAARLREQTNVAAIAFNPVSTAQGWTGPAQTDFLLSFIGQEIAADPDAAGRFRAFLATVSGESDAPEEMLCRECGERMFIEDNGVSHHEGGGLDGIDYRLDLDHVAVAEREP